MGKQKGLWLLVAAVVIVLAAWALSKNNQPKQAEETPTPTPTVQAKELKGSIKVGFLIPLTGDAAAYGEPGKNVMQMALDEINAAGGVKGKKLVGIFEDAKCNGKDAANAMQKLVTVDKVKVVIGGFCSSESLAAVPIAARNKVALFSAGSSSPDLTGKSKYFSRDYPSDATQGSVLAEVSYNDKKWKKVAFIQEQLDYPLGIYKAYSATFTKLGGKITKQEFPSATTDFKSLLSKLKAEKPDALFIDTQTPAAGERIAKQLKELKWTVPVLLSDAISGDPKTIDNNKEVLEGALAAEYGIDVSNPKFQALLKNYKEKFGSDVPFQSYAQTEYDAPYLVRDALLEVGEDGTKIAAWLQSVKDWEGASGKVTIGSNGDRVGGHVPKVVKSGKVELYTK